VRSPGTNVTLTLSLSRSRERDENFQSLRLARRTGVCAEWRDLV